MFCRNSYLNLSSHSSRIRIQSRGVRSYLLSFAVHSNETKFVCLFVCLFVCFRRMACYLFENVRLLLCFALTYLSPFTSLQTSTYLLTYLLTSCSRVLLQKLTGLQLVKKFPTFCGARMFITALTSSRHLSLSWVSSIQSITPHPTSWRSILILSSHLHLRLPSGLFPSICPTKTLYTPLLCTIRATCPAHRSLLDFTTKLL